MKYREIILNYYKNSSTKITLILSTLAFFFCVLLWHFSSQNEGQTSVNTSSTKVEPILDQVAENTILIPLELLNAEAISQMVHMEARADLYASFQSPHSRSQKVASDIKIIKSPGENASFFALVHIKDERLIHRLQQSLFAVIKKSNHKNKAHVQKKPPILTIKGEQL